MSEEITLKVGKFPEMNLIPVKSEGTRESNQLTLVPFRNQCKKQLLNDLYEL
jgi:hypothetical protein